MATRFVQQERAYDSQFGNYTLSWSYAMSSLFSEVYIAVPMRFENLSTLSLIVSLSIAPVVSLSSHPFIQLPRLLQTQYTRHLRWEPSSTTVLDQRKPTLCTTLHPVSTRRTSLFPLASCVIPIIWDGGSSHLRNQSFEST